MKIIHLLNTLYKLIKSWFGIRLIDPLEVFYDVEKNRIYPIISKSGNSTVKLKIIQQWNPEFIGAFPEIHRKDPSLLTEGKVRRLFFYQKRSYVEFCRNKSILLFIRNPYERFYSLFMGVKSKRNILYKDPAGMQGFVRVSEKTSLPSLLKFVVFVPDNLADKHFRRQTIFLDDKVEKVADSIKIQLLESLDDAFHVEGGGQGKSERLNIGQSRIPSSLREELKRHAGFQRRYSKDIRIYEELLLIVGSVILCEF